MQRFRSLWSTWRPVKGRISTFTRTPRCSSPLSGTAVFMSEDLRRESGPEEVVVVGPHTAHGFKTSGSQRLRMVCIHASGRMITEWLVDV
jgi:hypothetical protein